MNKYKQAKIKTQITPTIVKNLIEEIG